MKKIIAVLLFLSITCIACAENRPWHKLQKGETYLADFLLPAGESKKLDIDSTEPVKVGFRIDIPDYSMYKELADKYNGKIISIVDVNSGRSLKSAYGASLKCSPLDNKVPVEIYNLVDRDFNVVVYKESLAAKEEGVSSSTAGVQKFFAEGKGEFKKPGYLNEGGSMIKQLEAFCSVPVKGSDLEAAFELFMSKSCLDEKTYTNAPGIVIGLTVSNKNQNDLMYFGYKIALFDRGMNLIGEMAKVGKVKPHNSITSNPNINLTEQEIARIENYKITFYESKAALSKELIE